MQRLTVPLVAAAAAVLLTLAVTSITSKAADTSYAEDRAAIENLQARYLFAMVAAKLEPVESIMQPAFPFIDISTPVEAISTMITPENPAVLVRDFKTEKTFIITRSDIIRVMM